MGVLGQIETGIPLQGITNRDDKYGLKEFTEPGMSRTFRIKPNESISAAMSKINYAGHKLAPKEFACRTINKQTKTIRIWRTR